MTVPSPKTDRYDGQGSQVVPLSADLRPLLAEAFRRAAPGHTHVIGGGHPAKARGPTGRKNCDLRTAFAELVARAGLSPWPRPFRNLRASRETELLEPFPLHVVAGWMGHDARVSPRHHARTTDGHFARAAGGAGIGSPVRLGA